MSNQNFHKVVRDEIVAQYPGILNFDRATAARIVGVSVGHLRNCESAGRPLIAPVKIGAKVLYQLPDLVDFLTAQRAKKLVRRGPRTKAERIEAGGMQ